VDRRFKGAAEITPFVKVCAASSLILLLLGISKLLGSRLNFASIAISVASAAAWLVKATQTIIMKADPRKGRIPNLFVLTQVLCTTVFWPDRDPGMGRAIS
jgi:hypothetical protein